MIGTLKAAFVQGRLTKDEFDTRVAQTLAARTYADLSIVTVDIPPGLTDLPALGPLGPLGHPGPGPSVGPA